VSGYSYYEQMKALGASDAMIAGVDILGDAGLLNEQRLTTLVAVERQGMDPEAAARKLVKLCRQAERIQAEAEAKRASDQER
jgi:hypothetical protein